MACIPAPTCKLALKEAAERWPGRRSTSDGICASPQHSATNPKSDHEVGNAFDLSHDPEHGVDTYMLAELMRRKPDGRVKYVISNWRIWNPSISPDWRSYAGSNGHTHHMHVSIVPSARDNLASWWDRYFAPSEDDLFRYVIVTIPTTSNGIQLAGKDASGKTLGLFHNDVTATIKANDDGRPVQATVQVCKAAFSDELVLSFIGLDGKPAPQGNVGVVLSHPPR